MKSSLTQGSKPVSLCSIDQQDLHQVYQLQAQLIHVPTEMMHGVQG
uniref:Uncharacterized protein n=1 Tax=Medicago truncatula TaxID=3880 RepID=I3S5K2_MEDTR|nr:unknown [Medicago truncatula]